ncbi:hypothetical protein PLESTB_000079900 [Pleodorina starrii]|uniref:Uncharacterized protein n=1 Tax=Pleodorina starrii TaxID=330485 RepID=A0A9W6BA43_9CHLO|nr:hypothetical protein PLESTM_000076400 [Pleodorina starrii]GLC48289.1 hypothetical protein PLESTB_000079900 [Pleodorina starrii]GLC66575.1 hypothetical protein PLESTF_000445800 [Pleodorina starrii]
MGGSDDAFCGCLPWGRRREASAGANCRPTSAVKASGTASSAAKARGSFKTAPEPAPPKWRSQVGASDASSTASLHEGASDLGNGAVFVSATAFGSDDLSAALAAGRGTRSTLAASDVRLASQPQVHGRANGSVSSIGNPASSGYPASKGSGVIGSPIQRERVDVAFADPGDPAPGSGAAAAQGGGEAAASRLQDLQERYSHRFGGGAAAALAAGDDRFRSSDQMQCDSFTYSVSAQGRRSSYGGGGPTRLGPLPPLPPSPTRAVVQGQGGNGHHGQAVGTVQGISVSQQLLRDRRVKFDKAALDPRWQKSPPLATCSTDISRTTSLTTTHIPGSLPSMTQGQVSPGIMRINPPAAAVAGAWDEPPPAAAAAAPPPASAPLPVVPSRLAQAPWPCTESPRQSSNPPSTWGAMGEVRQAEQEQQLSGGSGGGGETETEAVSSLSTAGQPLSRLGAAARSAATDPPSVVRHSNNASGGGVAVHRPPHGPVGYSAAAAALPGFSAGERELLKKLSSGGTGLRSGGERMTSAAILAMEALARESRDSSDSPQPARVAQKAVAASGAGGGSGIDRPRGGPSLMRGGGGADSGGGRLSLPLYDSYAPGAVLAKPPSFGAGLEHHTSPGCIAVGPRPLAQALQLQAASGESPLLPPPAQPPQHQPSMRLQAAPPREDAPRCIEPRSAAIQQPDPGRALMEGPAKAGGVGAGAGGVGGDDGEAEPTSKVRPAARPSQQRLQAARANEEMLMALLGSSKRALDLSSPQGGGGAAAELERFDRVHDAMSRLDDLFAATPQPPPQPPARARAAAAPAAPARTSLNARVGPLENAACDFRGSTTPASNPAVKPW